MSREAFGDPPESQEPPDLCPVCGNDWHTEDCEFGKEVARRLNAERDAHRMQFALHRLWPAIERAMSGLAFTADRAGEVQADMSTLREYSKTPNKPLRRGVDGICTRSACECEREGLGDQCVWLGPNDAELERRTGEPHIDGYPLQSGLPPPAGDAPTTTTKE